MQIFRQTGDHIKSDFFTSLSLAPAPKALQTAAKKNLLITSQGFTRTKSDVHNAPRLPAKDRAGRAEIFGAALCFVVAPPFIITKNRTRKLERSNYVFRR